MGDRYLGAGDYWLNTGQLICIGPGETPQLLHRDELNWPQAMRDESGCTRASAAAGSARRRTTS